MGDTQAGRERGPLLAPLPDLHSRCAATIGRASSEEDGGRGWT